MPMIPYTPLPPPPVHVGDALLGYDPTRRKFTVRFRQFTTWTEAYLYDIRGEAIRFLYQNLEPGCRAFTLLSPH